MSLARSMSVLLVVGSLGALQAEEPAKPAIAPSGPTLTLSQLVAGQLQVVDLTYAINKESAYWPGENYQPFHLQTIATIERDGVLSKAFSMPEHLGTHIDAPNHFVAGRPSVDEIPPEDFFAPGVVIDCTAEVFQNNDFELSLEFLKHWESLHGPIPSGAVVMLRTGWSRYWDKPVRYQGRDTAGRLHFPGYGADAAKFLVEERNIRGIGIDTMSIDPGLSRTFAVHKIINGAKRYGLENVANLDKLPVRGFYLVVAPIKIETGSGGPTRVLAILPPDQ